MTEGTVRRSRGLAAFSAALAVLAAGVPASAHHSGSYFDLSATVEHHDVTVVSYHLVNPHARLVYTFTDGTGQEVEWTGELPGPNYMRRQGGLVSFRPGEKLASVTGAPSRSGANYMLLDRVVFENGDVADINHWGLRFLNGTRRPDGAGSSGIE